MLWNWEDRLITAAALLGGTAVSGLALLAPVPFEARSSSAPDYTFEVPAVVVPSTPRLDRPDWERNAVDGLLIPPPAVPKPGSAHGVPFVAHSIGSGFSVSGDYAGHVELVGGELVVRLNRAMVQSRGHGEPVRLAGVRVSLARTTPSGWMLTHRGPLVSIDRDVTSPERFWVEKAVLTVPDVDQQTLLGSTLVLEHELRFDEDGGRPAWTYVHADPTLLGAVAARGSGH